MTISENIGHTPTINTDYFIPKLYIKYMNVNVYTKICNRPKLNQPKRLSIDEWMNKLHDIYMMEYYSAIK